MDFWPVFQASPPKLNEDIQLLKAEISSKLVICVTHKHGSVGIPHTSQHQAPILYCAWSEQIWRLQELQELQNCNEGLGAGRECLGRGREAAEAQDEELGLQGQGSVENTFYSFGEI